MPSDGGQGGPGGEPAQGGQPGGQPGGPGGADTMTFDYTGTYTAAFTADGQQADTQGESIEATETDQNAVLAQNAGTAVLQDCTITKLGDNSDGDRCNFYGANSIVLSVNEGSQVVLGGCTLSATSEGLNGVFATDSAVAFVNDCGIDTSAGNSRGLDATYAGVVVASQVDIATEGDHCAAVATDRGGGTISVVGGTFSTAGSGSPLLYSTGNIQVNGIVGTASASQIAGMEGLNTILINNSVLESTNTGLTGSDSVANGVIIYQSTSGDAEATTGDAASFQAASSTLKAAITSGAMFYFTNTTANVVLSNTVLDFDSASSKLAYVAGNDANNWGTPGSNGAQVNFTATNQQLAGDVCADTTSTLSLYLLNGSIWSGLASIEGSVNGATSSAPLSVNVDGSSTWTVTSDAHLSALGVATGGSIVDTDGNTGRPSSRAGKPSSKAPQASLLQSMATIPAILSCPVPMSLRPRRMTAALSTSTSALPQHGRWARWSNPRLSRLACFSTRSGACCRLGCSGNRCLGQPAHLPISAHLLLAGEVRRLP